VKKIIHQPQSKNRFLAFKANQQPTVAAGEIPCLPGVAPSLVSRGARGVVGLLIFPAPTGLDWGTFGDTNHFIF